VLNFLSRPPYPAALALSRQRIRREFANAEYGYSRAMQELFALRRKNLSARPFSPDAFQAGTSR
jgi:hypothetical protein